MLAFISIFLELHNSIKNRLFYLMIFLMTSLWYWLRFGVEFELISSLVDFKKHLIGSCLNMVDDGVHIQFSKIHNPMKNHLFYLMMGFFLNSLWLACIQGRVWIDNVVSWLFKKYLIGGCLNMADVGVHIDFSKKKTNYCALAIFEFNSLYDEQLVISFLLAQLSIYIMIS